jgi:PAS domain S-box-containing protein
VDFHPDWAYEKIRSIGIPTAVSDGIWEAETAVVQGDGIEIPVSQVLISHLDANGNLEYLSTIIRDITAPKRAEEELRYLRNYLGNIINSMPSVLIGVDRESRVTQWNAEAQRTTGIPPEKALGRALSDVFSRLAASEEHVQQAMQERRIVSDSKQAYQVDGETYYEEVTIYPLVSDGLEGAVIRIDDVTEKVRMEEMMIQSEKMLSVGGLAAGMAHEINNPLAGMMQSANVLESRLTDVKMRANQEAAVAQGISMQAIWDFMEAREIPKMLDQIRESGKRASVIITNMLSFARKSDTSSGYHSLVELLDQTTELAGSDYDLKKKFDFRQIEISREYEEGLPDVPCEPGKVQQVLLNILRNGAEAMQDARMKAKESKMAYDVPRFILRLAHESLSDMVRVEIEDNGPGMDEETRKRIFEPFFTTKPTGRGTGLGLSVSYFIITENHGGTMSVVSVPGEGTTFIFRLPVNGRFPS